MAVFTRVKTWVSNEVLTASDLNSEFNNLLNNTIPASIEDYSADVSTMQTTADPGGVGTESLATTLAGELTRIRYKIKQIMNGAQWYSTPVGSLSTGGITRAAMVAVGQQVSSSSGTFVTSSTSRVDVTNLTVTITTTGRPVILKIVSDGSLASECYIARSSATHSANLYLMRGATDISIHNIYILANGATAVGQTFSVYDHVDVVAAGTYTYKYQVINISSGGTPTITMSNLKLVAFEL